MKFMEYLFAANVFVWGGIFYYLFHIKRHQRSLQNDLDNIKKAVDKGTKGE
ncbi:MAG: CcmD family protein [Nitrospinaceae bacterium]|jgi:CcmD family protein|nr:CcmD family protein [Nitrospinaceae bacterium]|tara:strand:- start:640 stop:792 length:153 start_codon:yes stop_codon:yes gene_type:complete